MDQGKSQRRRPARFSWLLAAGLALLWGTAPAQALYKTVGPDGRVTYTDHPPSGAKAKPLSSGTPAISLSPGAAPTTATRSTRPNLGAVTLYSAVWCGYCRQAKAYLASHGIAYREVDVESPSGAADFARAGGGRGIPLLVAGGQQIRGYSQASYDALFGR